MANFKTGSAIFIRMGLASMALGLGLAGCGGGGGAPAAPTALTPSEKVAKLEETGDLPALNRDSSLTGPDANGDGIRDDIEAYLQKRYTDKVALQPAQQLAKAMQLAVTASPADKALVTAADDAVTKAVSCIYARVTAANSPVGPGGVVSELQAITANTPARLRSYLAYNNALDGTATLLPAGDGCE